MAPSHVEAEAEKGHLLQEEEDEGSSSEVSGGRTAVASPTNRLASMDIEGLNDVDVEKEAASTQERPPKHGAKLIAWITLNTLATIGIVCYMAFWPSTSCARSPRADGVCVTIDLYQQGHLLRPFISAMSGLIRILPFLRNRLDPLRPLTASLRNVHA